MNVGLPVLTGFPLCVSCPFEDTRRFFTKPERKRQETISQNGLELWFQDKGFSRPCFSSNLTGPWSMWGQWDPHRFRKVPGEDRCLLWGIPRKGRRWSSVLCPLSGAAAGLQGLCRRLLFPKGDESEVISLPRYLCFLSLLAHLLLETLRSTY